MSGLVHRQPEPRRLQVLPQPPEPALPAPEPVRPVRPLQALAPEQPGRAQGQLPVPVPPRRVLLEPVLRGQKQERGRLEPLPPHHRSRWP